MAERGRPKAPLVLSDAERQTLQQWARRAKTAQALALRAKIVLACAEGTNNQDVAASLGVWPQTVSKWRARFVKKPPGGLSGETKAGGGPEITDEQVEAGMRMKPVGGYAPPARAPADPTPARAPAHGA